MHDPDAEARSEAARAMGSARTPAKMKHLEALAEKQKGVKRSEEAKQKMRDAWALRKQKALQAQDGEDGNSHED